MHVTVKKERTKLDKQKVKFKKFLREYEYEDWYLTNIMPREMMHEFTVSLFSVTIIFICVYLHCHFYLSMQVNKNISTR